MTDLDDALRTMLRERAQDIDAVPPHLLRPDEWTESGNVIDLVTRRRHTMQLIAASVVAVLALAAGLVGLQHVGGHGRSPANSGSPQPSTPPVVTKGAECQATLPKAWRGAFTTPTALGSPQSSMVLAMSDTGAALISRDLGSSRDMVLVQPGQAARTVFTVPDPAHLDAYNGGLYGNFAVVPLNWAPNSTFTSTVMRLEVINLRTGVPTQIAGTSNADRKTGRHVINGTVVLGGSVYWDVQTDATHGTVLKYDLATGKYAVAYNGSIAAGQAPVRTSAAGLIVAEPGGGFALRVHAPLPAEVSSRLNSQSALTVGTDGTAYAWFDQVKQTISWWSPGQAVRTVHTTLGQPDGDDSIPGVDVAGPYVFYIGPQSQVVDTRSGAVGTLPDQALVSGGGYVGTYLTNHHSGEQAGIVNTSGLPALHC